MNIYPICSVSSVLNKDVKQHGKMFMFDGLDDTAWYSDQVINIIIIIDQIIILIYQFYLFLFHSFHSQGLPQQINLLFNEPVAFRNSSRLQLQIKFQGGFVGNVMSVTLDDSTGRNIYKKCFYPDDTNDKQTFILDAADSIGVTPVTNSIKLPNNEIMTNVRKISITFEKSSDFYGRIIIYHMELARELVT